MARVFWVPSPAPALNPRGLSKPFHLSGSPIICKTIELSQVSYKPPSSTMTPVRQSSTLISSHSFIHSQAFYLRHLLCVGL